MRSVTLAFWAVSAVLFSPPVAAESIDLASHEALYRLALNKVELGESAQGGNGQFLLRVERRCKSWVLVTRLDFTLNLGGGRALVIETSGTTEESLDGRSLRFSQEKRLNGHVVESFKGRAALTAENSDGIALFDEPPDVRVTLPEQTLFPIASAIRTIENYKKGQKFQSYLLFNGDAIEGPHLVTEIVTGEFGETTRDVEGDMELLDGSGWRVVVSFFDFGAQDAEPTAVQVGEVLPNGVIPSFSIDMGEIETVARLLSIRALKEPTC